jgi:hypothetical protein
VREIPLHGKKAAGRVALVDDDDFALIASYRWWVHEVREKNHGPYAVGRPISDRRAALMYMHKLITGWPQTDHINHLGLDNQRHNLRPATRAQNNANARPIHRGASRYKGVTPCNGKWGAKIKAGGKAQWLGRFATEMEAAFAYDVAARRIFGEFACPNFPEGYIAMVNFHMDGPHTPATTLEAADLFAEGIRYLNHATMPGAGGLENPADAYSLLGALYTATGRLPQLLAQLTAFLDSQAGTGRLGDDQCREVSDQVASASLYLGACHRCATELTAGLQAAQNAIAGLYVKDGGDDA